MYLNENVSSALKRELEKAIKTYKRRLDANDVDPLISNILNEGQNQTYYLLATEDGKIVVTEDGINAIDMS
ncbi:MAG TPA: hypothetical protein PLS84_03335 [Salinivirgaceae bacterium]|nr:hypothetical protein [Salinivirgaceae bacterium]